MKRIGILVLAALLALMPISAMAVTSGVSNVTCNTTSTTVYTASTVPRGTVLLTNGGGTPVWVCMAATCTNLTGVLLGPGETFPMVAYTYASGSGYVQPPGTFSWAGAISCITDNANTILSAVAW